VIAIPEIEKYTFITTCKTHEEAAELTDFIDEILSGDKELVSVEDMGGQVKIIVQDAVEEPKEEPPANKDNP